MEIEKEQRNELRVLNRKIRSVITNEDNFMSIFSTLLGASDNIAQYVLEKEKGNYTKIPYQCAYGLLQMHQIMTLISGILRDKVTEKDFEVSGYFPSDAEAWKSEKDFEKRFILMVKLFYKHFKEKGKI